MVKELANFGFPVIGQRVFIQIIIRIQLNKCLTLDFKPRRNGSLIHITDCRQVIFGNPFPQFQLRMAHNRLLVKHHSHILDLEITWRTSRSAYHDAGIKLFTTERHYHTESDCDAPFHISRHTIGECGMQRQR